MSKHTPGPWTYRGRELGMAGAIVAKTGWICDFDTGPSQANARLIAAAPELLACLQLMVVSFAPPSYELEDATDDYLLENFPEWFRARAAIAKAIGEIK